MKNQKLLIKNGRVIDPANNRDKILDILVENGRISMVAKDIKNETKEIIDATGKIVLPGLVDMHVHLREPGREDKESVATATRAALKGGVTSVLAMPNTQPAMDDPGHVKLLKEIIKQTAVANVVIAGTITKERLGQELVDVAQLKKEGVVLVTDDGSSVDSDDLMLQALKEARSQGILVVCHCEDRVLAAGGVVNLGLTSTRLGLKGISKESEYQRLDRDLRLADISGASVHIAHVSCKESLELIARAKKKGIKVTAETCPHYFALSEEAVLGYDTNMKINPPLRGKEDVIAIRQGLANGIIDVIASDHAPHTENEKDIEFERAEFGTIGLETILAVAVTYLVDSGLLDWLGLARKVCLNPAQILGIDKGTLTIGKDADIVILAPDKEWTVDRQGLVSKSKNSAFLGCRLKGVVEYTICSGKVAYKKVDTLKNNLSL